MEKFMNTNHTLRERCGTYFASLRIFLSLFDFCPMDADNCFQTFGCGPVEVTSESLSSSSILKVGMSSSIPIVNNALPKLLG